MNLIGAILYRTIISGGELRESEIRKRRYELQLRGVRKSGATKRGLITVTLRVSLLIKITRKSKRQTPKELPVP